jgi:hypothetical protein
MASVLPAASAFSGIFSIDMAPIELPAPHDSLDFIGGW